MNNGYELSFTIDANTHKITWFSHTNAWVGSTSYVVNSCYSSTGGVGQFPRALDTSMFHACQNGGGFHIILGSNNACAERIIDVYLGFDDQLSVDCQNNPIPFAPGVSKYPSIVLYTLCAKNSCIYIRYTNTSLQYWYIRLG